jgi:hypothetical protein
MNRLNGTIPTQLRSLGNVWELWLDRNRLVGSLPTELSELVELQILCLSDNSLTGSIPSDLARLPMLQDLWLDGNSGIEGSVPLELCTLMFRNESCDSVFCDPTRLLQVAVDCGHVQCTCERNCTCGAPQ